MRVIGEYKMVDGKMKLVTREMTAEEEAELEALQEAEPAPQPTQLDKIEAQVLYTALITDTLIEEE